MTDEGYFAALQDALIEAGHFRPVLVIDWGRLEANIDHVRGRLGDLPVRLVDKSLALPRLLAHLMQRLGTKRIMSFHMPTARSMLQQFPECEILFGKPMPREAISRMIREVPEAQVPTQPRPSASAAA